MNCWQITVTDSDDPNLVIEKTTTAPMSKDDAEIAAYQLAQGNPYLVEAAAQ